MGIFSKNRSSLGSYSGDEIVANESYYGELGALQITLEGLQNDQALFEALIQHDFETTAGVNEGAINESQYQAITEGALADFGNKIKEFVKKIWEKIKGLFKSFLVKVNNVIIRDNKTFVEKYKKDVLTKDLSKLKFKWEEPKGKDVFAKVENSVSIIDQIITEANNEKDPDKLDEYHTELTDGTFADDFLSDIVPNTTEADFEKDFHEESYEPESEETGMKHDILADIIKHLVEKDATSKVEKDMKTVDKSFSKAMRDVDKQLNAIIKEVPSKDKDKDKNSENQIQMKRLTFIHAALSKTQSLFSKVASAEIKEIKFGISQSRRLFAKAAAFNPKSIKENTLFVEAAGDAAYHDITTLFEDYSR